jgi:hypothetical protein
MRKFPYFSYFKGIIAVNISVITDKFTALVETLPIKVNYKNSVAFKFYIKSSLHSKFLFESYLSVGPSDV